MLNNLPESIWKLLWSILPGSGFKVTVTPFGFANGTIKYRCKWAFYYGLNTQTEPIIVNTSYLKNILINSIIKKENMKFSVEGTIGEVDPTYLVGISYMISDSRHGLTFDFARNKFTRDNHMWQPILFNRVKL